MNMQLHESILVADGDHSMISLLNLFIRSLGCGHAIAWANASDLADDYDLDQVHIAERMALSMKEAIEPGLNPVAFVKENALTEHGIEGVEVKPNDPDDRFIVTDHAEAEACFSNLLWEMAEKRELSEGKKTLVAHILTHCGHELHVDTQERLDAHFTF